MNGRGKKGGQGANAAEGAGEKVQERWRRPPGERSTGDGKRGGKTGNHGAKTKKTRGQRGGTPKRGEGRKEGERKKKERGTKEGGNKGRIRRGEGRAGGPASRAHSSRGGQSLAG